MPQLKLYLFFEDRLLDLYKADKLPKHLIVTLAMMLTGLFLGRHVQLWQMAVWVPLNVCLPSIVRRFERWLANPEIETAKFFQPFVLAMQVALGDETAYLLIDCTQAGKKCRTLLIGLAYHGSVLPIVWKTVRGNKGHVTGELHRALLQEIYPRFRHHRRVVWYWAMRNSATKRSSAGYSRSSGTSCSGSRAATCCKPDRVANGSLPKHCTRLPVCNRVRSATGPTSLSQQHQFAGLHVTVQWAEGEDEVICLVSTLPAGEQPHVVYEMRYWIEMS